MLISHSSSRYQRTRKISICAQVFAAETQRRLSLVRGKLVFVLRPLMEVRNIDSLNRQFLV